MLWGCQLNVVGGLSLSQSVDLVIVGARVVFRVQSQRTVGFFKTKIPTEEKSSPGNSLQKVESGINSRCISGAGGSCKPVEIENGSDKTVGLELVEASTGLSGT
ncbi:hypothetical protein Hdeb2414_s0023g00625041 [Helianthus debilis subsp. tardiflorus]